MTNQNDRAMGNVLPIAEEKVEVEKRTVLRGKFRVHSVTDVIEEAVRVDLESDEFDITRVPIGQRVTSPPVVRTEGNVTIVPVLEEVLVVEKHLMLVEELHVRRTNST